MTEEKQFHDHELEKLKNLVIEEEFANYNRKESSDK